MLLSSRNSPEISSWGKELVSSASLPLGVTPVGRTPVCPYLVPSYICEEARPRDC